jgi:hypothetical protein
MPFVEILFMINLHWICIIFAVVTKYSAHGSFQLQTELGTQGGGREGRGVLSYVICLLPSWALEYGRVIARYIHFHQNRHWTLLDLVCVWPSVFTRTSRLGRNLCRWQLWVCFLECCSNTLERIKIAVRCSYRRNPHPVRHIQNHCLPGPHLTQGWNGLSHIHYLPGSLPCLRKPIIGPKPEVSFRQSLLENFGTLAWNKLRPPTQQNYHIYISLAAYHVQLKQKICPATAMQATRGEKGYSSYSFLISALDGVSGQHHAPAALYPRGKDPLYPQDRRLGGPQSWSGHRGWRKNPLPLPRIEPRSSNLPSL